MNKKIIVVVVFILLVAGLFFFKKNSEAPPDKGNVTPDAVGEVVQVETFDQVFSHKLPVLAELGANWCAPCKQMRPIILGLKKEFSGRLVVDLVDVDIEKAKVSAYGKYVQLSSIPVQLLISADGKLLWQHVGSLPEQQLRTVIAEKTGVK